MKHYAIIVAGGTGSRMNSDVPKQFLLLGGKPILMHTIERFFRADKTIEFIVVIPKNGIDPWKKNCDQHSFTLAHQVIEGGETRFHSVKNGLTAVKEKSIVAIHDGARPFTSNALINSCFSEAEKYGNAVPVIQLNESIRKISGEHSEIADRKSFVIVQTPQCFESEILKKAYTVDHQDIFTDDASVVEFNGIEIYLVQGEPENIKITYPFDLITGESILKKINEKNNGIR